MTHVELKELLIERLGWKQTPSSFSITLDSQNTTSQSGRFYNTDEHAFVSLPNIYNTMENEGADDIEFNQFLKDTVSQVILLVLSDVFEISNVDDEILTGREQIFDNAISKRMAIVVGEIMLTSQQSNRNERIAKEYQQKLFFEINGSEGNPNFPNYVGVKSRYGQEINKLKDLLDQEKSLDTFTHRLPNYLNDDNILLFP